ncbi:hypothetical protein AHOG_05715 [Actinoalloteichus hoggarensis]|uniref:Uncharacterized protein n=1 Tax=Actinoalloteichus hoggarensis TaxID=1470176 RepID=A0A221VZ53_9PSEU|nr:hypothetical protein AHOG_05715 [Actinoalloteichus hoggarensis]
MAPHRGEAEPLIIAVQPADGAVTHLARCPATSTPTSLLPRLWRSLAGGNDTAVTVFDAVMLPELLDRGPPAATPHRGTQPQPDGTAQTSSRSAWSTKLWTLPIIRVTRSSSVSVSRVWRISGFFLPRMYSGQASSAQR